MACRCNERGRALVSAASSIARGQVKVAGQNMAFVGRTLVQDVRSGALKSAATARLAQLKSGLKVR
ncbi:MAG: hypothetical protein IJ935_03215 [Afipia sp.]|nr:hypothetical protein [Afipia sp.]